MYAITLTQLAVALLGAGSYLYYCRSRGGYWKACAILRGSRIERDHRDPYVALAAAATVVQASEAQQAAEQARDTPAARAAYLAAWQATEGQPIPARFAAAEQAHQQATRCHTCSGSGTNHHEIWNPADFGRAHKCYTCNGTGQQPAQPDEPEEEEDEPEDEAEAIYQYEMRLAHRQAQENY